MAKFGKVFDAAVEDVIARADEHGLSITELADRAGMSRATISRWRREPPTTITSLERLQDEVEAVEVAAASAPTAVAEPIQE